MWQLSETVKAAIITGGVIPVLAWLGRQVLKLRKELRAAIETGSLIDKLSASLKDVDDRLDAVEDDVRDWKRTHEQTLGEVKEMRRESNERLDQMHRDVLQAVSGQIPHRPPQK